jgi:calcineurin-like phosphoesterase family protein
MQFQIGRPVLVGQVCLRRVGLGWPQHRRGAWHFYGHSHGNLLDDLHSLSIDVGVDTHDFRPWHFDEIQAAMKANKIRQSC